MSAPVVNREKERGAALVVCLLIMAVLALLGAAMITNSTIEVKMAGNQRATKVDFYAADGAARLLTPRLSSPTDAVGAVADPETPNQWLEPVAAGWATYTANTDPAWGGPRQPMDYNYRIIYLHKGNPPKGYSQGSFAGFFYEVDAMVNNTAICTINMKIGPK
jgi:hypothetical protein